METISLRQPDDWHVHLRDGRVLADTVAHTARQFARAVIMPNLKPPVTTVDLALGYRERILQALPPGVEFTPLMTLYLTDNTSVATIDAAADSGVICGLKLYPAGATTNSDAGVTQLRSLDPVLERMAERGLVLQVHGEVTDPSVDVFAREGIFIDDVLAPLVERHPSLKVVLEHITTRHAVDFVRAAGPQIGATITPQHMRMNRNALFAGGIRPHHWCLPVLKAESHRRAVAEAASSGEAKFFLGTDTAPHARAAKESACGCAGMFSAATALELYAEAFEDLDALDRFEAFASLNGPEFYGLEPNAGRVMLVKQEQLIPDQYRFGADTVVPMGAGETLRWTFAGVQP